MIANTGNIGEQLVIRSQVVSDRHGPVETQGHPSQSKNLMPLESSIFKSLLNIYLEDWKKLIFYYKIFHLQNKEIITRT